MSRVKYCLILAMNQLRVGTVPLKRSQSSRFNGKSASREARYERKKEWDWNGRWCVG
jgi:hypothetical protein